MRYLVNQTQMKQYDLNTSSYYKVPEEVLVERAALAVVDVIEAEATLAYLKKQDIIRMDAIRKILVWCGNGNNGADGLAIARILHEKGYEVMVLLEENGHHRSRVNELEYQICCRYGIPMTDIFPDDEYDMVIDALFGIGLNRDILPETAKKMKVINHSRVPVLSVDIPSGMDADTGNILGEAVRADLTVTFSFEKTGMYRYPGKQLCGRLICRNVGITEASFLGKKPQYAIMEETDVEAWMNERPKDANKATFGKVLLFAGRKNMAGAAILAAKSCFRMGVGMVRVLTCPQNREYLFQSVPEAMLTVLEKEDTLQEQKTKLQEAVAWADVIAAGPGIGTEPEAGDILAELLSLSENKIMVLDADALNLISQNKRLQSLVVKRTSMSTVMTPHPGELSRLAGMTVEDLKAQMPVPHQMIVKRYGCILVAKDAVTTICLPDGNVYLSDSGNDGMATAGSGDVLTGMIAARCALCIGLVKAENRTRKIIETAEFSEKMKKAVLSAVYMHGMAGNTVLRHMEKDSLMAGDLVEAIPEMIGQIRSKQKKESRRKQA